MSRSCFAFFRQLAHLSKFLAATIVSASALAIPQSMPYQGTLFDEQGFPVNGSVEVVVGLFGSANSSDLLYSERHANVQVSGGLFEVFIGAGQAINGNFVSSRTDRAEEWIEVSINGETLTPRQRVSSAPYAFVAGDSVRLGGRTYEEVLSAAGGGGVVVDSVWDADIATVSSANRRVVVSNNEAFGEDAGVFKVIGNVAGPGFDTDVAIIGSASAFEPMHHLVVFENTRATTDSTETDFLNTAGLAIILRSDGADDLTDNPDESVVVNTINRNDHFITFYQRKANDETRIVGRIEGESLTDIGAVIERIGLLIAEHPPNEWLGIKFNPPDSWIQYRSPSLDFSRFRAPSLSGGQLPSLNFSRFSPPSFNPGSLPVLTTSNFRAPSLSVSSTFVNYSCEGNEGTASAPTQICIDIGIAEIDMGLPFPSINWGSLTRSDLGLGIAPGSLPVFNAGSLTSLSRFTSDIQLNPGRLPVLTLNSLSSISRLSSDLRFDPGLLQFIKPPVEFDFDGEALAQDLLDFSAGYPNKVAEMVANPIMPLIKQATLAAGGSGITYESGSGDYAEWLERLDPREEIKPGEVVGVFGGKISRATEGADHIMVISMKPIVLGNMPEDGRQRLYEKVAFMGQTLVYVKGPVKKGDLLVPSGQNDGFARGVDPSYLEPEQIDEILGVAWSEHTTFKPDGIGSVNVAVGLRSSESAELIARQQSEIQYLREQHQATVSRLEQVEQSHQQMAQRLETLLQTLEGYVSDGPAPDARIVGLTRENP
ncbi:MAG: hypothetical protein ACFHX7_06380 [Pseudomonadota bacterium]